MGREGEESGGGRERGEEGQGTLHHSPCSPSFSAFPCGESSERPQ